MMSGPANARALLGRGSELLLRLYGTRLPLVIACTGHALAAGALLVLTGDVRIAAEGPFKIGLNEVAIGLPVPVLAMELARDRLSHRELVRATLLATVYPPSEALAAGYVDRVVATADVLDAARKEAARLGAVAQPAYAHTKARLRKRTIEHIRGAFDADMAELMPL